VTYLVNKQLLDQVKPITVDFVESGWGSGFSISSSLKKAEAVKRKLLLLTFQAASLKKRKS